MQVVPTIRKGTFNGTKIARIKIEVHGDDEKGCRPNRIYAVAPTRRRDYVGYLPIRTLIVYHILEPLLVGCEGIKVEQPNLLGDMCVSCPAILFALRAISGNAHEVGEIRLAYGLPDEVERIVGATEPTSRLHCGMDKECLNILFINLDIRMRMHLNIPETMIGKLRTQHIPTSAQCVNIRLEAETFPFVEETCNAINIQPPVRVQFLTVLHFYHCTRRSLQRQSCIAGHVLSEVNDIDTVTNGAKGNRVIYRIHLDGRHLLSHKLG